MKYFFLFICLYLALAGHTLGQTPAPTFISKSTGSLELLLGSGTRFGGMVTVDLNFQYRLYPRLSVLTFTHTDVMPFNRNPDKTYLAIRYFNVLQSVGVGSSVGKKGFNAGLYLAGGFRYYHSKEMVNGLQEPALAINSILPETGMLLNIKAGKSRVYFAGQIYYQFAPMDPATRNKNLTLGVGYRL